MNNRLINWLIYTVCIGLIPVFCRFIIYSFTDFDLNPVSASDLVAFGLILHISNIKEVEYANVNTEWKTIQNGISIVFIVLYSILFSLTIFSEISEQIKIQTIEKCVLGMSFVSFLLSFSVYYKSSKSVDMNYG